MNFCTECGQKIEQKANFCPGCGFQLKSASVHNQNSTSSLRLQSERGELQLLIRHLLEKLEFWNIDIARPKSSMPLYIQASKENDGWLLEASSENYTNPSINKDQIAQLINLGFSEPNDAVCLNYWRKEANLDLAVEKLVEIFFDVFHFDYKESIRGTTPEVNLKRYLKDNLSDAFTLLKVKNSFS